MFEFYEKRRLKRLVYSKPVIAVVGGLVLLAGVPVYNVYQKFIDTLERKEAVAAELARVEYREAVLREEIERLDTPLGREAEIRQKFELGREGEQLIIIIEDEEEGVSEEFVPEEPVSHSRMRALLPW